MEKTILTNFQTLITKCRDIRRIGSAALDLCYVAMGRTDSFFEFGIREWDIAAGLIILKEAGGCASSIGGHSLDLHARNILACSTEDLRTQLVSHLEDIDMLAVARAIAS